MFDKFTNRAKQVIKLGKKEAQRMNHNYLGTEHILLGLLKLGQGVAVNVLRNLSVESEAVRAEVEKLVGLGPEIQVYGDPALTGKVKKVFEYANEEAAKLGHNYVGTEHLLLGLLRQTDGVAVEILASLGVDTKEVEDEVMKELESFNLQLPPLNLEPAQPSSGSGGLIGPSSMKEKGAEKMPSLKAYGHDLTQLAREDEIDPVIGRSEEIERLILILCRRRKNNPVLVGEAGVGKTAIVEGLAHAIVHGNVPENLRSKKLISLDLALMVAGTKYRGQFEERIKSVMDEIKKSGNVLLFIDELHTIVGAGAAEGAIDASNILKPALSRSEMQCIGATTIDEYRKHIEKDPALERRFQTIQVAPPSVPETIEILKGLKGKYEAHHKCSYTDCALATAAEYSDRYVHGRYLPDKAIDLIDEAGAKTRVSRDSEPPDLAEIEVSIHSAKADKEKAIENQEYEKAAQFRDEEKKLKEKLKVLTQEWNAQREDQKVIVDEDHIAEVVARQTGIPVNRLTQGETQRVLELEKTLQEKLIGQEDALKTICRAIRRSSADIKDPKRPIGSFLFLGPTGVGKTMMAKLLATQMFGGQEALIQVDMSEYMEKFAVSRMTGSPPGYVGHDDGGQLTEQVRQRPYSVVLFDEIEKAHPDVMDILLQILEEGSLTDSFGRKINFRNTIVIMTSNLGADLIRKSGEMGFGAKEGTPDYETIRSRILEATKKHFKPEFVNRVDDVVTFHPLDKDHLRKIIDLEVIKVQERLEKKHIFIELDQKAKDFLIDLGFEPEMGARPLRRTIEQNLEDPLAEKILREPDLGRRMKVDVKEDKLFFEDLEVFEKPTPAGKSSKSEQEATSKESKSAGPASRPVSSKDANNA